MYKADIQNLGKLQKKLNNTLPGAAKKGLRQGLRSGCKLIQAQAIADAQTETGQFKRSIKVRAMKKSTKAIGMKVVSYFKDKEGEGKKVFYAPFVMWGHKTAGRRTIFGRRKPGKKVEANNTMKEAAVKRKGEAFAVTFKVTWAAIEKAGKA